MSEVTKQQLLDKLTAISDKAGEVAARIASTESSLTAAQEAIDIAFNRLSGVDDLVIALRGMVERLPDAPPVPIPPPVKRGILHGQQYESRWDADRNGKPVDLLDYQRARAWRELLGADVVRWTYDVSHALTPYGRTKIDHDLAGFAHANIPMIVADVRCYLPSKAVIVEDGQYPKQCRICSHSPTYHVDLGSRCVLCERLQLGLDAVPDLWQRVGKVIRPVHNLVLADPRTVYRQGYTWVDNTHGGCISPVDWHSDKVVGPHGASWYFDEELAYVRNPPHINPVVVERLGFNNGEEIGDRIHALEIPNEIGQLPYNPTAIYHEIAWREGRGEAVEPLREASVLRMNAEFIGPFLAGFYSSPKAKNVERWGYAADTDVIFNVTKKLLPKPYKETLHIYAWTYAAMMALIRSRSLDDDPLWVSECNAPSPDKSVADLYRELDETKRVAGMIVHGDEWGVKRNENEPYGYELTDVGRELVGMRG